jgi:hypothetical protein
MARRIR